MSRARLLLRSGGIVFVYRVGHCTADLLVSCTYPKCSSEIVNYGRQKNILLLTLGDSVTNQDLFCSLSIARQHAYECKARNCYGKSVCPSVRYTLVLYINECIQLQTTLSTVCCGHLVLFRALPALKKLQGNSISRGVKYTRVGKLRISTEIAVYLRNGIYEIGPTIVAMRLLTGSYG